MQSILAHQIQVELVQLRPINVLLLLILRIRFVRVTQKSSVKLQSHEKRRASKYREYPAWVKLHLGVLILSLLVLAKH
jgi:hypothetical protein